MKKMRGKGIPLKNRIDTTIDKKINDYVSQLKCPNCGKSEKWNVKLSSLECGECGVLHHPPPEIKKHLHWYS